MIPDEKENREILDKVVKAHNIVTRGIKNQNLKGASVFSMPPEEPLEPAGISVMHDQLYGIKNICKKFGLVTE